MEKYLRVLEMLKAKGGTMAADDADLKTMLGQSKTTGKDMIARTCGYISQIRRFAKLEVRMVRGEDRRATRFELVVANPSVPITDDAHWQSSKYIGGSRQTEPDAPDAAVTVTNE
jgi:hypothetical protein